MKRIKEYKSLFNVEGPIVLGEIKKTYRNLVKEWHPDKFQEGDEKAAEAEEMTQQITAGYEFLISIAPETKEKSLAEYTETLNEVFIEDFQHKGMKLEVTFSNGMCYEYFGVSRNLYIKFVNSPKQMRFAKRNIFHSFLYRKSKRDLVQA